MALIFALLLILQALCQSTTVPAAKSTSTNAAPVSTTGAAPVTTTAADSTTTTSSTTAAVATTTSTAAPTTTTGSAPPASGCAAHVGCLACAQDTDCVWCATYRATSTSVEGVCTEGGFSGANSDMNKAVAEQCSDYRFRECVLPFMYVIYVGSAVLGVVVLCCTACVCYCVCFRKKRGASSASSRSLFGRGGSGDSDSDRTPLVAKGETDASRRRDEMRKKWGIGQTSDDS